MAPLAVVGNLSLDVVDGGPPQAGGAPFHCGRALAALGVPAVIVAACAQEHEDMLAGSLRELGVPVRWRKSATTAAFAISNDGDRREMTVLALGEPWRADAWLEDALGDAEWAHLGALARSDFPPPTVAALARGRRLSLDGQGLVRPSRTGLLEVDGAFDPAVLEHVAVLKVSEEEATALTGGTDPAPLAALGVPEVLLTLGARGVLVIAGGRAEQVPAQPVVQTSDPTGAGDAFAVGYIDARARGAAPIEAATLAAGLAARLLLR
jgi:sugar/nucleoside kinase (ribokinase family)